MGFGKKLGVGALAALLLVPWCREGSRAAGGKLTGVEGVAALQGKLLPGVVVLAFSAPGPDGEARPLAVSEATGEGGAYRLPLAPGSYHLAAVRTSGDPWPPRAREGDLFSYYLGNPVVVEKAKMTRVGFNMVKVPAAGGTLAGTETGLRGQVLFQGRPLGRAYVHVYRDPWTNFRGMGVAAVPTKEDGSFRIKLPPGRYYAVARKRRGGGAYGPPGKDDHVGYYHGNPVDVGAGEAITLAIATATRVDLVEKEWFAGVQGAGWLRGVVVDGAGGPVPGQYVLFYADAARDGAPVVVAGPTDEGGRFKVRSVRGEYYLLARSSLGGPLEEGEWYGRYSDSTGREQIDGTRAGEITIVVRPYRGE